MDKPSLEQATKWFEEIFDVVETVDHDIPGLFILIDDRLKMEGEDIELSNIPEDDLPSEWYYAAVTLVELRGGPKKLIWRIKPECKDGHIYSRFAV